MNIKRQISKTALQLTLVLFLSAPQSHAASSTTSNDQNRMGNEIDVLLQERIVDPIKTGKRAIRVLVTYNASNYFIVEGRQAGLEYELMHAFENHLNKGRSAETKIHLIFISLPFDQLIPALLAGKGDIIAAGMTITPGRSDKVAFSDAYRKNVAEVVVRNKEAPKVDNPSGLGGKTVHVVKGSSYYAHLKKLNTKLKKDSKPAITIVESDQSLVSEDVLQMVNAGIYQYTVVDSHIADLWSNMLENIVVEKSVEISDDNKLGWAVRKNDKDLKQALNKFLKNYKQGTKDGNILYNRYYKNTRWISNPVSDKTLQRLGEYKKSFIKYGKEYNIEWLMLAAQGYQESKLNQNQASAQGAVGVMQIKPSTAADKNINITGVKDSHDRNIHAATKYLAFLRTRYFSDPKIPPIEQLAFTLAAYNAGPARIVNMRNKAKSLGKNPDIWFFNVENVTREHASSEPVNYVANIMKYYLAFKSVVDAEYEKSQAIKKLDK